MTDRHPLELEKSAASGAKLAASNSGMLLVACFCISSLLSALLLFFIQPMFTKMALPLLGGASGVWNTAMVFFQAVLLGGYLYAHLLSKYFRFKLQVLIHGIVLFTSTFFLPILIPEGWSVPEAAGTPTLWIIGLFGAALGAPFFALSANAPLLQRWFSYTDHKSSQDPYFLYAASNLGSLFSLLSYPILIEPVFKLSNQTFYWSVGFIVLASMIVVSGFFGDRRKAIVSSGQATDQQTSTDEPIAWNRRLLWIACSLVPSGLMLGVTTHITANVASAPFLWVMPLAIYLLTFVFAFSPKPVFTPRVLNLLFPPVAILILLSASLHLFPFSVELAIHLIGYFLITMMCHTRLSQARPGPSRLTEFYLLMSLGGVMGGALVALLAPVIFNDAFEYPLLTTAAALLMVGTFPQRSKWGSELLFIGLVLAAIFTFITTMSTFEPNTRTTLAIAILCAMVAIGILMRAQPIRMALALFGSWVIFFNTGAITGADDPHIFKERSFFGIAKVNTATNEYGLAHTFVHGNTLHNIQLRDEAAQTHPLAYYAPEGSFGQAIDAVRADRGKLDVAAIGLGAGALACHAKPGENWRFYEIDPLIVKMAKDPAYFSFMEKCGPAMPVEVGDARLTLTKLEPKSKDLIIVDAFSSDSVPVHLVTKEALELYRSYLKDDGFIFFHTSNRYLNMSVVVSNLAQGNGLGARAIDFVPNESMKYHQLIRASKAVLVGNDASLDRILKDFPGWHKREVNPSIGVWTDDFSHIIGAMMAHEKSFKPTN